MLRYVMVYSITQDKSIHIFPILQSISHIIAYPIIIWGIDFVDFGFMNILKQVYIYPVYYLIVKNRLFVKIRNLL